MVTVVFILRARLLWFFFSVVFTFPHCSSTHIRYPQKAQYVYTCVVCRISMLRYDDTAYRALLMFIYSIYTRIYSNIHRIYVWWLICMYNVSCVALVTKYTNRSKDFNIWLRSWNKRLHQLKTDIYLRSAAINISRISEIKKTALFILTQRSNTYQKKDHDDAGQKRKDNLGSMVYVYIYIRIHPSVYIYTYLFIYCTSYFIPGFAQRMTIGFCFKYLNDHQLLIINKIFSQTTSHFTKVCDQ